MKKFLSILGTLALSLVFIGFQGCKPEQPVVSPASESPCQNDGIAQNGGCTCQPGYIGEYCELRYSEVLTGVWKTDQPTDPYYISIEASSSSVTVYNFVNRGDRFTANLSQQTLTIEENTVLDPICGLRVPVSGRNGIITKENDTYILSIDMKGTQQECNGISGSLPSSAKLVFRRVSSESCRNLLVEETCVETPSKKLHGFWSLDPASSTSMLPHSIFVDVASSEEVVSLFNLFGRGGFVMAGIFQNSIQIRDEFLPVYYYNNNGEYMEVIDDHVIGAISWDGTSISFQGAVRNTSTDQWEVFSAIYKERVSASGGSYLADCFGLRTGRMIELTTDWWSGAEIEFGYGNGDSEDEYMIGDWDGDGKDNIAVRRGRELVLDYDFNSEADFRFGYGNGNAEDEYLIGDWDGDGTDNVAVRRGRELVLDYDFDSEADFRFGYGNGNAEDEYLIGDWDGDGIDNIAVRRGRQLLLDYNFDSKADLIFSYGKGNSEDEYLVGDWDNDGKDNIAVRRGKEILMDFNFDDKVDFIRYYGNGGSDEQYLIGNWD